MARVQGETHKLHPRMGSTKAPSVSTAVTPATKSTPAKTTVRDSPAFDEASEAVDRASFAKDHQATPVPHRRTPLSKPALSQVPEEAPQGLPPQRNEPAPRKTVPRADIEMPPPVKPKSPSRKPATRPRSQVSTSGASPASKLLSWSDSAKKFFTGLWLGIKDYIKTILSILGLLLLLLLLLFGTENSISRNVGYTYHTTVNNIRHYTPDAITHPMYWFNHESIRNLNKRVTVLEVDVDQLKLDVERDHQAIEGLSKQLPDFVVARKNKKGDLELPIDFWHAVKGKIITDKEFQEFGKKGDSKPAAVNWTDFWLSNEQRVKKIAADEVKVSRAEIEKIIQRDIESVKKHGAEDVAKMRKQIESYYAKKSDQLSQPQIKKLVDEASHRQLSSSKIEAVISNKIREQSSQRKRTYNYFADKMGAIVMPGETSPTWKPNYYKEVSVGGKVLGKALKLAGTKPPVPFGPETALKNWEDAGDCWCASTKEHGAQLQVRTKEHFFPSEIIVEHVNQEATLDKGAAPKDMELFVKVGLDNQDEIASASERMFPDAKEETVLDHTWIRIARWTYDLEANENIQVFGLQLDLKRYGVTVNDFVVRAKTNWGQPPPDHTCFYRVTVHGSMPEDEKTEL